MLVSSSLSVVALWAGLYRCVHAQWSPQVAIETRTIDEIYQAARCEIGELTVLWGGDARIEVQPLVDQWQQTFPDVALNLTLDVTKYHDSNIDRSFYAHDEYVDVAVLQALQDFPRWKSQNRLLYYKPANFSLIYDGEKDLDGAWLPMFEFAIGDWIYDSTALNASDLPTSFADVLDPKWKGKLVLVYPNDDDAIAYLFSLIIQKYGFGWLDALVQQDVKWVRGTGTPGFVVDPAQRNATDASRVLTFSGAVDGVSTAVQSSPQTIDQRMAWFQRGGIFASAPHPESAKLFVSWLHSYAIQSEFAFGGSATPYAYLNDISGVSPYSSNVSQIDGFDRFMADRATVEWWRFQYETSLGPPVGEDPAVTFDQLVRPPPNPFGSNGTIFNETQPTNGSTTTTTTQLLPSASSGAR